MRTIIVLALVLLAGCELYSTSPQAPDAGISEPDSGCPVEPEPGYVPHMIICQPHVGECACSVDAQPINCTQPMLDFCATLDEHSCWVNPWP